MKRMPLKGTLIVDFGHILAGPYGTKQLQSLGATVIKVESRKSPDNYRYGFMRPGVKDFINEGGWNCQENSMSKMGFSLNIKSKKAHEVLHELVKKADVVTANLSPGGFHKMGIDYETLSKVKEDIIVINASGMGDTGPYSSYRTAAPIMQALSGLTSLVGYEGEGPYGVSTVFADYVGGAFLSAAVVSALEYRRRTGKGQFIDLSSTEATLCTIGAEVTKYSVTGVDHVTFGNHHYTKQMAPHCCYPCKGEDQWCVIAVASEDEWDRFKDALRGECCWVDDEKFATMELRLANQAELDANISGFTKNCNNKVLSHRLQNAGVSAGMVQSIAEFLDDEHALSRNLIQKTYFPESDNPVKFNRITGRLINIASSPDIEYKLAPGIGQDNDYILKELLGMSDAQIQEAAEDGAFA